ncbi:GNAT family N-acetyltransferase [Kribbella turkmenica]|uniref:GNAT family N-acetyltransferase n=2 Tax=Kribbella turkmenica TaxID=2530375 RepID=A0A4V2YGX3_9ACTN|nr:GNAT family N-acetyltransferase [Kribbella turkmenica]
MPQLVKTARGIEAELRNSTRRIVLIAVDGAEVVGYGNVFLPDPGEQAPRVRISVQVPPGERRRGIGGALAEAVTAKAAKAGAASLLVVVDDSEESKEFATRRGFTIGRRMSHSRADLSAVPAPAAPPEGLRDVDFDQVEPEQVWRAVVAVAKGDPSGLSLAPPYDEWLATDWGHADLRRDLSVAVLDGGTVASFVVTTADPERRVIWSNLTGTIPAQRGRGLAKVVKSAALARARDAGFIQAYTGNDAGNAPMLAVNSWLGYQVSSAAYTAEKNL